MRWLVFVVIPSVFGSGHSLRTTTADRPPVSIPVYGSTPLSAASSDLHAHHAALLDEGHRHVTFRGGGPFGGLGPRSPSSTANLTSVDAVIAITPSRHHQYVVRTGIGTPPQEFDLVLDTGSTNAWAVGNACTSKSCEGVPSFRPEASSTFRYPSDRVSLDIMFGTGRIQGTTAVDDFNIGPFKIPNQTFCLVEREEGDSHSRVNVFEEIKFQGILGLAFPSMSSTHDSPTFDNLLSQNVLDEPDFSIYISDRGTAKLLLGGVDPTLYVPPLRFAPVAREHYWEVALKEFWVGDEKFCCDDVEKTKGLPSYVIFDSGTTFNTIPSHETDAFFSLVPRDQRCPPEGSSAAELQAGGYKTLRYVLDNGIVIELTPEMYLLPSESRDSCKPAYMQIDVPSPFGHAYILGTYGYMRHYFTLFRRGVGGAPSQVGVALAQSPSFPFLSPIRPSRL